jgi:tetratricopeptide (TPR) repeat protein
MVSLPWLLLGAAAALDADAADERSVERAQALLERGHRRAREGDALGALPLYEQCRAEGGRIRSAALAQAVEAAARGGLGRAYEALGRVQEAIAHASAALAISRELGDAESEATHLGNLGNAALRAGQPTAAADHHGRALRIATDLGDRHGAGRHHGNLANALDGLGRSAEAIAHYTSALRVVEGGADRASEGAHRANLGACLLRLGRHAAAAEQLTPAVAIARRLSDARAEGRALRNLGRVWSRVGRDEEAVHAHERARPPCPACAHTHAPRACMRVCMEPTDAVRDPIAAPPVRVQARWSWSGRPAQAVKPTAGQLTAKAS